MTDRFSIIFFSAAGFIVRLLPLTLVQRLGKLNGMFFFYLLPIRKKVALSNLDICFPGKDINWKNKIIKEAYINLGINMLEFLYLPKLNKNIINKFVKAINSDLVDEAMRKGKGTMFVGGHFSNWELMGFSFPALSGYKLNIITKIQASKGLNEKINEYRKLNGNEMIEIGFSLKKIFERLKKNELIGFLIDQSAHPDYSSYINFFGKKVATFSGPAKIALRQRPELIFGFFLRDGDNNYKLEFKKIPYEDLIENTEENILELTQRIQSEFETVIRNNPGQWLWFHKRFKHMKN